MVLKADFQSGDSYTAADADAVAAAVNLLSTPQPVLEAFHEFTKDADGAVGATSDSGHAWTKTYNRIAAQLTISGGRLIDADTATGTSAGYMTATLAESCTFVRGDFDFAAGGSTDGHRAVIALWATNLPSGVIGAIPDCPLHLVMGPGHFDYGVWSGTNYTILGQHYYATAFTTATQHVEVTIDRSAETATVLSPDGETVVFHNALIGSITAPYATVEVYLTASNTDHDVRWQRWAAGYAPSSGGGGGTPDANSVGWTELDASGTPSATTFLKVAADGALSAAVPSAGSVMSANITDSGAVGRAVVQAETQAAGRAALGVGGAVVTAMYANVVDYGADPSGSGDSGAAFRSAANVAGAVSRPIFVPAGNYRFTTSIFTSGALRNLSITGPNIGYADWANGATLQLAANTYVVDSAVYPYGFHASGLAVVGGAGAFRWTNTDQDVYGHKTIRDCFFYMYTKAAISSEQQDSPYWKIQNCQFRAANCTTSMGIALAGWSDCSDLSGNSFLLNRVSMKIGRMGPNTHIRDNDYLRFDYSAGYPRVDLWFPTMVNPSPIGMNDVYAYTQGVVGGIMVRDCKFGNELYDSADYRVLIADEGTGTYVGERFPVTNATSTGLAGGITVTNCSGYGTGGAKLVHSTTPNLVGMVIGPIWESGGTYPLLSLRYATGFDPSKNIVGPIHSPGGINPITMTVADSGTLTGQCKTMSVV